MKSRVENKYLCDAKDLAVLQSRLKLLMKADSHVSQTGEYVIKSIYFDDYFHSGFHENEDGIHQRSKYRIRCYNNDTEHLKLEIKNKIYSYIHKISCPLTKEQARAAIMGRGLPMIEDMPEAYAKTFMKMRMDLLKPNVIVEYVREPYIYKEGNVRITFDKQISASKNIESFFEPTVGKTPILETGKFILEVKYDEFLPTHIYNALGLRDLNQIAFSKYYMSRNMIKSTFVQNRGIKNYDISRFI